MVSKPIIRFDNISKSFGNLMAVKNISLEIIQGEILAILGPNGAGKSTMFKMLAGLLRPTSGKISIQENNLDFFLHHRKNDFVLNKMGFLIETANFFDEVTPRQILSYFARLNCYPKSKISSRIQEILTFVNMFEWADKNIKNFSKGMKQRIGIACAIIHDPEIIVLDEPASGLDPKAQKEMREFILSLKAQRKTIILSSHLLYEVSEIADRIAFINKGEIIECDTLKNLESKIKNSIIYLSLMPNTNQSSLEIEKRIVEIISQISQSSSSNLSVKSNSDHNLFEIHYDGTSNLQNLILKSLIAKNIPILDFSVPKTSMLEQLYLTLVGESYKSEEKSNMSAKINQNLNMKSLKMEELT